MDGDTEAVPGALMAISEASLRRRHRGYGALLSICLALVGCLMLPAGLRQLSALGYVVLPLVLIRTLGRHGRAGRWEVLRTRLYRLLALATLASALFWYFTPLLQWFTGLPLLFLMGALVVWSCQRLMLQLAQEPLVNKQVLMGALAGYLLLGLAAGLLFSAMQTVDPRSFAGGGLSKMLLPQTPVWQIDFVALNYFAFVTLTTTGYGDIHPGTPQTQMLCALVAIAGTTYQVVVMGLLIGRFTAQDVEQVIEEENKGHRH